MTPSAGPVAGLVLAAGASSRMGRPKPLLDLDGRTYLEAVVDALRTGGTQPVAVVLGAAAEAIWTGTDREGLVRVDNRGWRRGMLSSWVAGLEALAAHPRGPAAAVVALVDVPRFSAATVAALTAAWERTGRPIVVPSHRGGAGHPILVARSVWGELATAPRGQGARAVVRADPGRVATVEVDDPWILRDADTPAEHRALRGATPDPT